MKKSRLGNSDLLISAMGLGCMNMSEYYGPTDDAESVATIHRALELGINFLDSSDLYGNGHNERLLSLVLAERRQQVVLATKFGFVRMTDGTVTGVSGKREYVFHACEASLRRLGVDWIDLYYQHRVDPSTPIEETVGAMADLVSQGKVRFLGLSEAGAATIRRAHAVHPISAVQTEYSLWERGIEREILPVCRELGITLVAYSPLGRAFLTGAIRDVAVLSADDFRRTIPRFEPENLANNLRIIHALESCARRHGATPSQIALAWLLSRGDDVVPIPGTRRRAHLVENIKALGITLPAEEYSQLEEAAASVAGERYSLSGLKRVNI